MATSNTNTRKDMSKQQLQQLLYVRLDEDNFNEAEKILKHGADINSPYTLHESKSVITLLQHYLKNGDYKHAEFLLKHGANSNLSKTLLNTPLFSAIHRKDVEAVRVLLKYKVDVNLEFPTSDSTIVVESPIDKSDVNLVSINPLIYVILKIKSHMKYLISHHGIHTYGDTNWIIYHKHDPYYVILRLLLKNKATADIDIYPGMPLLSYTLWNHLYGVAELLLDHGADVNRKDALGGFPIYFVDPYSVNLLFKYKPDLNRTDGAGLTIMYLAVLNYPVNIYKKLQEYGGDINAVNKEQGNITPLFFACKYDKKDIVSYLIKQPSVQLDIKIHGKTVYEWARSFTEFSFEITNFILDTLEPKEIWDGWTRSDAKQMNSILSNDKDAVYNYSFCPICLLHTKRTEGEADEPVQCIYMKHDCRDYNRPFNRELYYKYKNEYGQIEWCSICNRISYYHRHFEYADPSAHVPQLITIGKRGNAPEFYNKKSCFTEGGGGVNEKVSRFIALREFAKELNSSAGKLSKADAIKQLSEAFWKGGKPVAKNTESLLDRLKRQGRIFLTRRLKRYQVRSKNFLPNRPPEPNTAQTTTRVITRSNENMRDLKPLLSKDVAKYDMTIDETVKPAVLFRHRAQDGRTIIEHKEGDGVHGIGGEWLSFDTVTERIKEYTKNFGTKEFGNCIWNCGALLYPDEVEDVVPKGVYEEYKNKFNKHIARKLRGGKRFNTRKYRARGGNEPIGIFGEMDNVICSKEL